MFDGVRVHGIQPRVPPNCSSGSPPPDGLTVAVFGERRVKLLRLLVDAGDDGGVVSVRLELEQRLPGFDHWVLDACFLEVYTLGRAAWSLHSRREASFSSVIRACSSRL